MTEFIKYTLKEEGLFGVLILTGAATLMITLVLFLMMILKWFMIVPVAIFLVLLYFQTTLED